MKKIHQLGVLVNSSLLVGMLAASSGAHAWFQVVESWDISKATMKRAEAFSESRLSNIMSENRQSPANTAASTPSSSHQDASSMDASSSTTPGVEFIGGGGVGNQESGSKAIAPGSMSGDFQVSK